MPPKAAAPPVAAAIEKKDGAKVVYITIPLIGDESVKISLNTTCRVDILIDCAIRKLTKQFADKIATAETELATANGVESPVAETVNNIQTLLTRLREALGRLKECNVSCADLIENGVAVNLGNSLPLTASEILRPSGVYKLATIAAEAGQAPTPI